MPSHAPKFLPAAKGNDRPYTRSKASLLSSRVKDGIGSEEFQGPSRMGRGIHQGVLTGCTRPPYPQVNRRFGRNTRETVIGLRDTGVLDNKYDKTLVESRAVPQILPSHSVLGQDAAPALLAGIRAFEPGPHHWLFGS